MSSDSDWRLTDQESWMVGLAFRWARWSTKDPAWDHDHCEFCWAEFPAVAGEASSHDEGWRSQVEDRWVCDPCFSDFKERFKWVVLA